MCESHVYVIVYQFKKRKNNIVMDKQMFSTGYTEYFFRGVFSQVSGA